MRTPLTPMLRRAALAGLLVCALMVGTAAAADYVVIKVSHRPAGELVEAVRALLSPDGTVISDERNNTLIIMDDASVLKKCRELVDTLDVAARHVRLSVTFFEAQDKHAAALSVRWRYRDGGFTIGSFSDGHGPEGLTVGGFGGVTEKSGTSMTTQELLVMSGGLGRFVTGTDVPVSEDVLVRIGNKIVIREGVVFRTVSTGFVFTPTILDAEVRLDIIPFLSYFIDEQEGAIVFYEAATSVSIPDGRTVVIAENETDNGRLVGDIFSGFSASRTTGSFYIAVTPRIEE